MKYHFSYLFFFVLTTISLQASSLLTESSKKKEDPASLAYPAYIPLVTEEEQRLRPHEGMGSLAVRALAAVGKSGRVIENYLPSNVEDQLVLAKQQHERFRTTIVRCIEEINTKPERQCNAGSWGFMITKPVYRPLELDIQQSIVQDWLNLEYAYEDGTTPLLHLIELQIAQFANEPSLKIQYLKKALQTHRASLFSLVKALCIVCGRHDDIVSILSPYIKDQLKEKLTTPQLEKLRTLFVELALKERLVGYHEWKKLADLGKRLGFTRESINQLIKKVVAQPSEDGVKKVETVYVLVLAGGDINELVIDEKNGLVRLMEAICQDGVWPANGNDLTLMYLLDDYTRPRTIDLSSEDLASIQHLSPVDSKTIAEILDTAFNWKSSPASKHPLYDFLTGCCRRRLLERYHVKLSPETKRSWDQQMLILINKTMPDQIKRAFANVSSIIQFEELREVFVRLAREESLSKDELADFGRQLEFSREFLNRLIEDIILQPSNDGVRKVKTIYILTMAGGDSNELIIEGKNGLVRLMEAICDDEVWPFEDNSVCLAYMFSLYIEPPTPQMHSKEVLAREHLTKIAPKTFTQVIEVACRWRSHPDRMHPFICFFNCNSTQNFLTRMNVELGDVEKRALKQQVLLNKIRYGRPSDRKASDPVRLTIDRLIDELMPEGNYVQWLYDMIQEAKLSNDEFFSRNTLHTQLKKEDFLNELIFLGAKRANT